MALSNSSTNQSRFDGYRTTGWKFGLFMAGISTPIGAVPLHGVERNALVTLGVIGKSSSLSNDEWDLVTGFGNCIDAARIVWKARPFHLTSVASQITIPTIVMDGEVDPLCPEFRHHELVDALLTPVCDFRLAGMGHVLPLEAAEKVVDAIVKMSEIC